MHFFSGSQKGANDAVIKYGIERDIIEFDKSFIYFEPHIVRYLFNHV